MAWKSAAYSGTHQERKEASKALRSNARRAALTEATDDAEPIKQPHAARKKPYGLRMFYRSYRGQPWEFVTWYATERARNDALVAANKDANLAIMPIVAIGKCER